MTFLALEHNQAHAPHREAQLLSGQLSKHGCLISGHRLATGADQSFQTDAQGMYTFRDLAYAGVEKCAYPDGMFIAGEGGRE